MDERTYFFEHIIKGCFNKYFVDYFKHRFDLNVIFKPPYHDYLLVCFYDDDDDDDDDGECYGSVSFTYDLDDGEKYLIRHFLKEPIIHAVRKDFDNIEHFHLHNLDVETPSDLKPILLDVLGLKDDYHSFYKDEYLEELIGEEVF